jgi:hypothetical protein
MRPGCWSANVAGLAAVIALLGASRATAAIRDSNYRLDTYAFQLNGESQLVTSLDGGFVDGTVVTEATGVMPKKHIAGTAVEPVRARIQINQFTEFLAQSLEGKADVAKGSIYYIDSAGKVQQQRDLGGVALSELAFPGFSGSPRPGSLQLTMTLAAESTKAVDVLAGALPPVKAEIGPAANAKRWTGLFRFQVPGLPTNRVSMIEPFAIRRKTASDASGQKTPTTSVQWEVPNLVFYMPPQDSQAWIAWHDDFVVQGHNSDAQEKTFTLTLLSADLKDTLFQLEGSGVGIVSAKYEQPVTAATTSVMQGFRVELYVENMRIGTNAKSRFVAPVKQ